MKLSMRLTVKGLIRALRWQAVTLRENVSVRAEKQKAGRAK